jgi:hypothetical protein
MIAWTSCSREKQSEDPASFRIDLTSFLERDRISPREIMADIKYIKLASPDTFFLTEARKLLSFNGKLIALDKNKKLLVAYDTIGNFLGQVGKRGLGPDEYQAIMDFDVDWSGNRLVAFSSADQAVLLYDSELNFQKKIRINTYASQMSVLESGHLAFYGYPEGGGPNIKVYSMLGKHLYDFMEFPKGDYVPMNYTGFISGNYFTYPLSGTIYRWDEAGNRAVEGYTITIPDGYPEESRFNHHSFMNTPMFSKNNNILTRFTIGGKFNDELLFYYSYKRGGETGFTLGVKLSGGQVFSHHHLKHGVKDQSDLFVRLFFTGPYNLPVYSKSTDYYYTAATVESMEYLYDSNKKSILLDEIKTTDSLLHELIQNIKENDNPLVLRFRLKNHYDLSH